MEIVFKKQNGNNLVTYVRDDWSTETENPGPDIPHHDLAHLVVEQEFKLENGFGGNINRGMTIAELSDKETIKSLPTESWLSEILTRNLQALLSGAAEPDQFVKLVEWEVQSMPEIICPPIELDQVQNMIAKYRMLCEKWEKLPKNESLKLRFDI